jgi:hypothetical protein
MVEPQEQIDQLKRAWCEEIERRADALEQWARCLEELTARRQKLCALRDEVEHQRKTRDVFMDVLVRTGCALDMLLAMQHKDLPPADTCPEEAKKLLPWTVHYEVWDCWRRLKLEHDRLVSAGVIERVL